jgi:hypothetical protein
MTEVLRYYYQAKRSVYQHGFFSEIYWQEKANTESVDVQTFLSEHAWVILSSGMNVKVVEKLFVSLAPIFRHWKNVDYILKHKIQIKLAASQRFAHSSKLDAIIHMSVYVAAHGLADTMNSIQQSGTEFLEQFPFLGPATSKHFAKNLGFNISKPDRHLVRISKKFGYLSTDNLCREISEKTGDKMNVIDVVLWRYATINRNYLNS